MAIKSLVVQNRRRDGSALHGEVEPNVPLRYSLDGFTLSIMNNILNIFVSNILMSFLGHYNYTYRHPQYKGYLIM
jgi:hypothetical protein